ncbi:MAG TPA: hypothetical protein VIP79_08535 [Gemmatimonadaceae bacterium]
MSRFATIAMSALLIVFSASCSSDALPTGPSNQASQPQVNPLLGLPIGDILGGTTDAIGGLLVCEPQPYASASKVIGPDGGTLYIGKHTFVVPRGALKSKVLITAEAPEGNVISVRFAPEGLKFNSKAQPKLTLDYSTCGLIPNLLPKHIAYTDDQLSILSILSSVDNLLKQQVSANIKHFSRYAIAF